MRLILLLTTITLCNISTGMANSMKVNDYSNIFAAYQNCDVPNRKGIVEAVYQFIEDISNRKVDPYKTHDKITSLEIRENICPELKKELSGLGSMNGANPYKK